MDLQFYKESITPIFEFLQTLSKEQIEYKPAKDKWSVHEIIIHLADVEVHAHCRIRSILANKNKSLINNDEMDWSIILDYSSTNLEDAGNLIKLLRKINYELLIKLKTEHFKLKGIHSIRGDISLENLIEMYAQHTLNHLNQMKRNILTI